MADLTKYEKERLARIARNRALLESLDLAKSADELAAASAAAAAAAAAVDASAVSRHGCDRDFFGGNSNDGGISRRSERLREIGANSRKQLVDFSSSESDRYLSSGSSGDEGDKEEEEGEGEGGGCASRRAAGRRKRGKSDSDQRKSRKKTANEVHDDVAAKTPLTPRRFQSDGGKKRSDDEDEDIEDEYHPENASSSDFSSSYGEEGSAEEDEEAGDGAVSAGKQRKSTARGQRRHGHGSAQPAKAIRRKSGKGGQVRETSCWRKDEDEACLGKGVKKADGSNRGGRLAEEDVAMDQQDHNATVAMVTMDADDELALQQALALSLGQSLDAVNVPTEGLVQASAHEQEVNVKADGCFAERGDEDGGNGSDKRKGRGGGGKGRKGLGCHETEKKNDGGKQVGKRRLGPPPPTEEEVDALFYIFDDRSRGKISYKDVERMATLHDFTWSDEQIQDMIDFYDNDGDKRLDLAEFRAMVQSCNVTLV
ncbi:hypothetical protein CBR_g23736 [Chara braunii]|uniref:EF-hand domain-containing protein n=1 Tax=Chara braunii TaxID=69332 RepID=A0A388JVE6_CHABU|nr:hypothetical protein CBR_g23736 [Chara braunii]|eukprot:GBG61776.1 hypothetical protein CBR_g23736 [Chara braunii]